MANEYFETSSSDRWDQHYSTSFAKTFMTAVPAEQSQVPRRIFIPAAIPRLIRRCSHQSCLLPPHLRRRHRRTLRADPFGSGIGAADAVRFVNSACRTHRREDGGLMPVGATAARLRRRYYAPSASPGT
jgi:hypothetical protein